MSDFDISLNLIMLVVYESEDDLSLCVVFLDWLVKVWLYLENLDPWSILAASQICQ